MFSGMLGGGGWDRPFCVMCFFFWCVFVFNIVPFKEKRILI